MTLKYRLGLLVVLLLGVAVGCTKQGAAPARVSGTVKYNGNLVKAGTIAFHSTDKGSYRAALGTDGTYEIIDAPASEMVVTIETESVKKKAAAYGGDKGGKMYNERMSAEKKAGRTIAMEQDQVSRYVKIPPKYANAKTSPLTVTLKPGRQVQEFDLKD